jgi:arsenate reductase
MSVTIWHNPRCSKSRATLAILQGCGLTPTVRLYLEDAPTEAELRHVLKLLSLPAAALIRARETAFSDAGLTKDSPDDSLIAAMAAHPILIERPVVLANGSAALGRPPEAVIGIL